jgi:hypothetical protein
MALEIICKTFFPVLHRVALLAIDFWLGGFHSVISETAV